MKRSFEFQYDYLDSANRFFVFNPVDATIGEINIFELRRADVISSYQTMQTITNNKTNIKGKEGLT
jgi:hypothetical protein